MRVLDLGVGAGRTARFLSPLCSDYVGVDYVPEMVATCKATIGESENVRFLVGDARDLSLFERQSFDLVVFSFNGIDYVERVDRLKILDEAIGVLRPGGFFFFSSHSLTMFPFWPRRPRVVWTKPLWSLKLQVNACRARRFYSRSNRLALAAEVQARGWVVMMDEAHDCTLRTYFTTPAAQADQLNEKNMILVQVLDIHGKPVLDLKSPGANRWFSYLCRKI